MSRELLASALGTTPSSSGFRMRLTSSAKYHLTEGGYRDENIALTPLGQRCVAPQDPDEARASLVEAACAPDIFRDFYQLLNGKRMPEDLYARNMLVRELSVHPDIASECLETIIANGLFSGILTTKGKDLVVNFDQEPAVSGSVVPMNQGSGQQPPMERRRRDAVVEDGNAPSAPGVFIGFVERSQTVNRIVDILCELGLHVVESDLSAESQSLSLSAEMTRAMQDCDAAIVIAPEDISNSDATDGAGHRAIWLILGAATFQYGEKVVLVETSPGTDWGPAPGFRIVAARPGHHEAAAIDILTALIDVKAVKIVA